MLSHLTAVKKQVEILQDTWACMVHLSSFIYSLTSLSFSKSLTLLLISHSSKTCQVKPVHRHTSMCTHTHARTHAYTYLCACTHTHSHTHTHTHSYTSLSLTSDRHHNIYKQCPSTQPTNQLTIPETGQVQGIRMNKNYFYNYAGN